MGIFYNVKMFVSMRYLTAVLYSYILYNPPHFMLKSTFSHPKIIYNTIISKSGRVFEIVVRNSQVANQFYKTVNLQL